jgi:hypothetical protein
MAGIRVTKVEVDVLVIPDNRNLRVTKVEADVMLRDSLIHSAFSASSKFKGASNKGGTKNTGTTSLVLNKPDGTAHGDTLVAIISDNAGSNTSITPPTGWTLVQDRQVDGTTLGQAIYYYPVPASAPTSFTWTLTGSVNSAGVINLLGNVGAVNVVGTQLNASSTNIVAPSVNVTSPNALLLFLATIAANTSITPPTGMIENLNSDQGHSGVTTEIAFSTPTPTGATGTRTGVAGAAGRNFGTLLAFEVLDIVEEELTADAVLMPSFTADAVLSRAPLSSFFTGILGRMDSTPGHFMPGNIDQPISSYEFTADAILRAILEQPFTADSIFLRQAQASVAADAVLLAEVLSQFTGDAILHRNIDGTFTADAFLFKVVESSFSANAVLFKTILNTISANAILRQNIEDDFTADSILQVVVQNSYTADAIVLATIGFTTTANAVLLKTATSSFTADSVFSIIVSGDFTADSLLLKVVSGGIVADAILLGIIEGSFTADSRLYPRPESVRNPHLSPDNAPFVLIGNVPSHLAGEIPDVRLSPGGLNQVGQGKFVKRVKIP